MLRYFFYLRKRKNIFVCQEFGTLSGCAVYAKKKKLKKKKNKKERKKQENTKNKQTNKQKPNKKQDTKSFHSQVADNLFQRMDLMVGRLCVRVWRLKEIIIVCFV